MKNEKINLLREMTKEYGLSAVLVYSPNWRKENFRYLTGMNFFGPCGLVLYIADSDDVTLVLASKWDKEKAQKSLSNINSYLTTARNWDGIKDYLLLKKIKSIGISGNSYMPASLASVIKDLGVNVKSVDGFLERKRLRKTPDEVEKLRSAVKLADKAFPVFLDSIKNGLNEYEIVAEVEYALKKMGAEDNFMLISTGGKDVYGMTPPQNRSAKDGDMILTELTPQLNGWWCQICRTVIKGKPNADQLRAFSIFYESVEAGYNAIKPGVSISDVAKAENDVFRKYGFGEYTTAKYTRVRGHGQGMHLDEAPTVNEGVNLTIEEGMVIVIHPNTYNPLCGYMVFGDPVVVTENGCEILSTTERKLFQV